MARTRGSRARPRRITLVNQFYAPDIPPTAQMAASLAEHRVARGDEVTVITGRGSYQAGVIEGHEALGQSANPRIIHLWTPGLGRFAMWKRVSDYLVFFVGAAWRFFTLRRQDVIISMTTPPFVVLAALAHKLLHRRTRVVLWSMDCYPDVAERSGTISPTGALSRTLRALNRWVFRRLHAVVCLDEPMRELLTGEYGAGPGRPTALVIPNWEPAAQFPPGASHAVWDGYQRLGLTNRFVMLYLGNAGTGHDFSTVLDAARVLDADGVSFLFVGGGIRWPELTEARDHGCRNVALHPYVPKDETPSVLAGAGCALIVLDDRALGVISPSKLHASLAMGLPVVYVGPEGSNVDEAVTRYECGFSLRHGDVEGLVAAIRVLQDPPVAESYGQRARKAFDEAYVDSRTLPQFDALIDG